MSKMIDVGIIGGGASGMMAAIHAARNGAEVVLFERNDRVGKKILATGNGKCNLGNLHMDGDCYYSENREQLLNILNQYTVADAIDFFEQLGLPVKSRNGYLYPYSEQAASVLDVLRFELKRLHIKVITDCRIASVQKMDHFFVIQAPQIKFLCKKIVLATGGMASPKTGSDGDGYIFAKKLGHSIIPTVPALVQLRCKETWLKSVSGVRTEAALTLTDEKGKILAKEHGELQLTDYGISGIPVFQISRVAAYYLKEHKQAIVSIDFFPGYTKEQLEKLFMQKRVFGPDETLEEYLTGFLNKKLIQVLIKINGLHPSDPVASVKPNRILQILMSAACVKVTITGTNTYEQAQVTAGGIPLTQIKNTMESTICEGLYLCGELLDVDGICGGYNLHWAWCSGYLAGTSAAAK